MTNFEMEDHLVLCNWAPRGLQWIREVHSKIILDKRPVVIIHDNPEGIVLPDQADESAFNDVYIVRGDPTNEDLWDTFQGTLVRLDTMTFFLKYLWPTFVEIDGLVLRESHIEWTPETWSRQREEGNYSNNRN